jgi:hypothetical protein
METNRRLTWAALPKGEAPKDGWPVYFSLVTDALNASDGVFNECASPPLEFSSHLNPSYGAFDLPKDVMRGCFPAHPDPHAHFACYFDSVAGAVWDQRVKQYLLANGVAVVLVNPWMNDLWEYEDLWDNGRDKPFLLEMIKQMSAGTFGPLDMSNVIFRGFSGGAQMVSWIIQKIAVGDITGVGMAGGIFLSGGSYNCYAEPPLSRGVCKSCNNSCAHHSGAGCSDGTWMHALALIHQNSHSASLPRRYGPSLLRLLLPRPIRRAVL